MYAGRCDQLPTINQDEVEAIKYVSWQEFLDIAKKQRRDYSEWSLEEALMLQEAMLVDADKRFQRLWQLWYN